MWHILRWYAITCLGRLRKTTKSENRDSRPPSRISDRDLRPMDCICGVTFNTRDPPVPYSGLLVTPFPVWKSVLETSVTLHSLQSSWVDGAQSVSVPPNGFFCRNTADSKVLCNSHAMESVTPSLPFSCQVNFFIGHAFHVNAIIAGHLDRKELVLTLTSQFKSSTALV
jgi:hypothetical protein